MPDAEPVFAEPWEAHAFALAVKLSEAGLFTWSEWSAALAEELAAASRRGDPDDGSRYYHHWLAALERLVAAKTSSPLHLCSREKRNGRRPTVGRPHGTPVTLEAAPHPSPLPAPSQPSPPSSGGKGGGKAARGRGPRQREGEGQQADENPPFMALLRSVATVGSYTLVSRVFGFVRDILTAAILGAGPVADAFFVAQRLPNLFRSLFAEGAFSAAFVPLVRRAPWPRAASEAARRLRRGRASRCCSRRCSVFVAARRNLHAGGDARDRARASAPSPASSRSPST